eukprot:364867-Chlamydomonas_euryale.AAC.1
MYIYVYICCGRALLCVGTLPIKHLGHVSKAHEPRIVKDVHEVGHTRRCSQQNGWVELAIRPSAHVGDPAHVGIVDGNEGVELLVCEATGLWQSVEKRCDGVQAA